MHTFAYNKLAYWNADHFKRGEQVQYGEFKATVLCHYYEGMWEIRVPGGITCVSGSELKKVKE